MDNHSLEGHTVRRFDKELSRLHRRVFEMGCLVRNQLAESILALNDGDRARARNIGKGDRKVNSLESEVDEQVIDFAARRSPVGRDLRMVLVVSKCVTELEEAGDEIVNIAEKVLRLYGFESRPPSPEWIMGLDKIAEKSEQMMCRAVDAYDHLNEQDAEDVIGEFRTLDNNYQSELRRLLSLDVQDSILVSQVVDIALIAESFKSIGQHAKKIAEYVIFYVRAEDVRHPLVD